ncbi:MAG: thioredoxin-disulfide reductase [Chloroflexi bacterium]|nr:thioredoxin-disulfide reductase [Chloroflexota bacterium]
MLNSGITVYGAPWCPDCKRSKQFLGEQRISYRWVDIEQDESGRNYVQRINNGKQIIPTIEFPDGSILVEPTNAELAAKLGIKPRAARHFYDLIVVGGGPTGLTAALYASREGIETLIIERSNVGGQAGITERIDNYPGFPDGISGDRLAEQMRVQCDRFGTEKLMAQAVTSIGTENRYKTVRTESGDEYCANALLIATGSKYRRLDVPGEDDYIGAGIHFCATCDGPFYKGKDVVVVGGGNSGLQEAIFLTKFASSVVILERSDRLKASQALQQKVNEHPDISVRLNAAVQSFNGDSKLRSVLVKDEKTGKTDEIAAEGAFIFIGLSPNTDFLRGTIELDQWGFIRTTETLHTNLDGVFAAGDVRAGSTKQIASAVGEGATAALMIRQYLEKMESSRAYRGD